MAPFARLAGFGYGCGCGCRRCRCLYRRGAGVNNSSTYCGDTNSSRLMKIELKLGACLNIFIRSSGAMMYHEQIGVNA